MIDEKNSVEDFITQREILLTRKPKVAKVIDIKEHRASHLDHLSEEERKTVCLLATIFVKNVLSLVSK